MSAAKSHTEIEQGLCQKAYAASEKKNKAPLIFSFLFSAECQVPQQAAAPGSLCFCDDTKLSCSELGNTAASVLCCHGPLNPTG